MAKILKGAMLLTSYLCILSINLLIRLYIRVLQLFWLCRSAVGERGWFCASSGHTTPFVCTLCTCTLSLTLECACMHSLPPYTSGDACMDLPAISAIRFQTAQGQIMGRSPWIMDSCCITHVIALGGIENSEALYDRNQSPKRKTAFFLMDVLFPLELIIEN